MPTDAGDRRRATRRLPDPAQSLSRVRLRAGRELEVINLSTADALVEGTTRLLPGTHVDVHVTSAHGRALRRARVVRCLVWSLRADEVRYRGALAFDSPLDLTGEGYLLPETGEVGESPPGGVYPAPSAMGGLPGDEIVGHEQVTV